MSLELLGATEIGDGFGYGDIFKGAGELLARGTDAVVQKQAEEKASADAESKLAAVIAADTNAAQAIAQSMTSDALAAKTTGAGKASAQAKAEADQAAMQVALANEDEAASVVPQTVVAKRVKAASEALTAATKKLQGDPTNTYSQNLVKAWSKVMTKAQNLQMKSIAPGTMVPLDRGWSTGKKVAVFSAVGVGLVAFIFALKKWVF